MHHRSSVFKNSCLKVPVDPVTKMPKTAHERRKKNVIGQCSIDSVSTTGSVCAVDVDAGKLKDFYRSIPDYNEINHLSSEQFYSTLKSLREKKSVMLGVALDNVDDYPQHKNIHDMPLDTTTLDVPNVVPKNKTTKSKSNFATTRKYSADSNNSYNEKPRLDLGRESKQNEQRLLKSTSLKKVGGSTLKKSSRKNANVVTDTYAKDDSKLTDFANDHLSVKNDRLRRNQSACSISWNDAKIESKNDIDHKFDQFFDGKKYYSPKKVDIGDEFKTQSMPSSPLRTRRTRSPTRRRKSITIPKPFKMTERDEEDRIVNQLRAIRKSFSDDMLHHKCERQQFRANPVPIESRIPLYDKILEDQAMRRAITKINSEADLRAQMKPFSFTEREENGIDGVCERATPLLPKAKKKKRFKARPVPKNLFSNYFYDRIKEQEFFRGMNRRIRAEELLKTSHLPGSMAARDRSRLSTPAAHSDLPIDPSPAALSITSSDRLRCSSPTKGRKKQTKADFITTSPQPFRFCTEVRANKKMEELTKKIYQDSKSTESMLDTGTGGKALSAWELRASASGRSNLAALLRAEAVRKRFDMEASRRIAEHQYRIEMRHRDRLLRSKPAWHLVKNNHEEDIAMRLQTRRDEERMRREEFLHEMELMYGRVQQQPMLFERYYAPRSYSAPTDSILLSPRKTKRRSKKSSYSSPDRSRKVSINDTAETFNGDVAEYLDRLHDDLSDSDVGIDSDAGK